MKMNLRPLASWVEEDPLLMKTQELVRDPMFWETEAEWVCLAPIGFPNYVLMEDGSLYKLNSVGRMERQVKPTVKPPQNKLSVTLTWQKVSAQILLANLVAWAFIPREPNYGVRVGYKDRNYQNVHKDNLFWI